MLTVYRRHVKCCPHRSEGRGYRRCRCPVWLDTRINGRRVHKTVNLTDWDQAQVLAQKWLQEGDATVKAEQPPLAKTEGLITLELAWEKFLAKVRDRNLRPATIYKYDLLRRQMRSFAQGRGL